MNQIMVFALQSMAIGLLATIAWVLLWSVLLPDVWPGHDDLTVPVFLVTAVITAGVLVWNWLTSL